MLLAQPVKSVGRGLRLAGLVLVLHCGGLPLVSTRVPEAALAFDFTAATQFCPKHEAAIAAQSSAHSDRSMQAFMCILRCQLKQCNDYKLRQQLASDHSCKHEKASPIVGTKAIIQTFTIVQIGSGDLRTHMHTY
jgi:hypothetical protein